MGEVRWLRKACVRTCSWDYIYFTVKTNEHCTSTWCSFRRIIRLTCLYDAEYVWFMRSRITRLAQFTSFSYFTDTLSFSIFGKKWFRLIIVAWCVLISFFRLTPCVCVWVCVDVCVNVVFFVLLEKTRGIGRRCGVEVRLHFIYCPLAVVSSAPRIFSFPLSFDQIWSAREWEKENVCVVTDWLLHHHIYWRRRYLLYIHKTFLYHFFVSYSIRLSQTVHCGHPYF